MPLYVGYIAAICSVTPMSVNRSTKSGTNLVQAWTAVAGASTYNVYRNTSSDPATWTGPGVATGLTVLTWSDVGQLSNTTTQFYSVTDVNTCGAESPK